MDRVDFRMLTTCGIYLYSVRYRKILISHDTKSSWKQWSVPKRLKEQGEESFEVACRELKEETGIDTDKLNVVKVFPFLSIKYQKQNKTLKSFLVIIGSDLENHLFNSNAIRQGSIPEVDSCKWIHYSRQKRGFTKASKKTCVPFRSGSNYIQIEIE